jgi:HK97 family phage portal protein
MAMKEKIFSKFSFKNKASKVSEKKGVASAVAASEFAAFQSHKKGAEMKAYIQVPGKPVWSGRSYEKFAEEGYIKNVIANRCISLISKGAASVPMNLFRVNKYGEKVKVRDHKVLSLLAKPNLLRSGVEFMEEIYAYKLISGNAFVQMVGGNENEYNVEPEELYNLRPERVSVIPGSNGMPIGYCYKVGKREKNFYINSITGQSKILHLRNFHPLDDLYGLSPIESAAYSIDQHNESSKWNQAMLQNGARPSGALVVKSENGDNFLTEEQFDRLKKQLGDEFSGASNAGKPILLEGGLEWKEMSLSPRDMDFLNIKHSSARDIALAFGVPSQLLGIPGDNTYSNMAEARLSLWEQTILPMMNNVMNALNGWLLPMFGDGLRLEYDIDSIDALTLRRDSKWSRISGADFLSEDEKREMLGV